MIVETVSILTLEHCSGQPGVVPVPAALEPLFGTVDARSPVDGPVRLLAGEGPLVSGIVVGALTDRGGGGRCRCLLPVGLVVASVGTSHHPSTIW